MMFAAISLWVLPLHPGASPWIASADDSPQASADDSPQASADVSPQASADTSKTLQAEQHAVIAALLFNFGKFVSWPEEAFADPRARFRIGLVGGGGDRQRFVEALQSIARNKKISGREVEIVAVGNGMDGSTCQIVFFPRRASTDRIAGQALSRRVLTVGESETFLDDGGMILMSIVEGRVALEINEERAWNSGLKISSSLLDIAHRVIPRSKGRRP